MCVRGIYPDLLAFDEVVCVESMNTYVRRCGLEYVS